MEKCFVCGKSSERFSDNSFQVENDLTDPRPILMCDELCLLSFAMRSVMSVAWADGSETPEIDLKRVFQSNLNKMAGKAKSEAKAAAARKNGRKGGRPRSSK